MRAAGILAALVFVILATPAAGSILDVARPSLPILVGAFKTHWPAAPSKEIAAGQVEQESRWKATARLKTSREDGRGLVQITTAYDAAGRERFNAFRDAMAYKALRGWDWRADPENVRYQLAYLVLRDKDAYQQFDRYFDSDADRWAAALVAYNAGGGTVIGRRARARDSPGVNPRKWFGADGLEAVRLPYESRKLYGRDLGEMRNEYPRIIIKTRAPKYRPIMA